MIESFDGRVTSSVSGSTDFLIVGKEPGLSKVSKARMQPRCRLVDLRTLTDELANGSVRAVGEAEPLVIQGDFSSGYVARGRALGLAQHASPEQLDVAAGIKRTISCGSTPPASKRRGRTTVRKTKVK